MRDRDFFFTNEELRKFVREAEVTVSGLLKQFPATAEWGRKFTNLQLSESLTSPFTVAIVGQMKAGKSTLVNALVGQDDLVPIGVEETTATINHFRHGSGPECGKFRIHWKDDAVKAANEPLEALKDWVHKGSNIEKAKFLEFRADAEFLKDYHLIDTPGTRSVVAEHEEATRGFLAERREDETLVYGSRANAVLYVINPHAREDDAKLLQGFGDETRLPGFSPYNSIAVIQKWDTLHIEAVGELNRLRDLAERKDADWARFLPEKVDPNKLKPDPLAIAQLRRADLKTALAGKVSRVIPVSGLLANQLRDVPDDVWPVLAELGAGRPGAESPGEAVATLLLSKKYFAKDLPGVSLDTVERKQLLDAVPWHILRFSVRLAYARRIGDGAVLRQTVKEACGIETLDAVLQTQFNVKRQGLVKSLSALIKLRSYAQSGIMRLGQCAVALNLAQEAMDVLCGPQYNTVSDLDVVRDSIKALRKSAGIEIEQLEEFRDELALYVEEAHIHAERFQNDIYYLDKLAEVDVIPNNMREDAYALLGGDGSKVSEVWKRLGLESEEQMRKKGLEVAQLQYASWQTYSHQAYGDSLEICEHVMERLRDILNYLDSDTPR